MHLTASRILVFRVHFSTSAELYSHVCFRSNRWNFFESTVGSVPLLAQKLSVAAEILRIDIHHVQKDDLSPGDNLKKE